MYLLYEKYRDPAEARTIAEVLTKAGIPYELEDDSNLLSALAYPMDRVNTQVQLRIRGGDFGRANEVLKAYYRAQIRFTAPDYMLFAFPDEQLREIIYKPDEWGLFNVVLAEHILAERGAPVDEARVSSEQRRRLEQQRRPERADGLWLLSGYLAILAGGFLGIFVGLYLLRGKKTLPNGERVFVYAAPVRRRGLVLLIVSSVVFLLVVVGYMASDPQSGYLFPGFRWWRPF